MTDGEMTNIIYDTLMGNTQYKQLDLDEVDNQEVDSKDCLVLFDYENIHVHMDIHITDRQ